MPASTPIIAVLTPRGRGAVATVRFVGDCRLIEAGDRTLFRAANKKPLTEQPLGRVVFGRWGDDPAEEVVVCRHQKDTLDVHCHGGQAAIERLIGDFESIACRQVDWQELESRCWGFLQAECLEALTRATTIRTANLLLEQSSGLLQSALVALQQAEWTAEESRHKVLHRLQSLLGWAEFGRHLTEPWKVVIVGRPNVGKSSLINALVGYSRSIVFDQPGTTRDVVTAETAFDGWPVQLSDTAGLRGAGDEIESAGIERARRQFAGADCRVLLFDTSQPPSDDDHRLLSDWPGSIIIAHKCDLPDVWGENTPTGSLRVSSKTGEGVEHLSRTIIARLIPNLPPSNTPIPITPRQVVLLREALQAVQQNDEPGFRRAVSTLLTGKQG